MASIEHRANVPDQAIRHRQRAGILLLAAGVLVLMGIITAEALYPDVYTTNANEISDLGATRPPNSIILQPSARIFDVTMMLSGSLILAATAFVHLAYGKRQLTIFTALLGLGALGVGVFPGNWSVPHPIFALTTFLSGGIAAVLWGRSEKPPFGYVSLALGLMTLLSLVVGLFASSVQPFDDLGAGGVERWIAYPIVLWMVALGGYLMSSPANRQDVTDAA